MAYVKNDFGFGFNISAFSDRFLHIEVINDSLDSQEEVVEVQTVHISSLVVSASSPFFYKLFINGMKESTERNVRLRVKQSEVGSLMEVLKFVYTNTLNGLETDKLMGVMMVADKFEFTSCLRYCTELLKKKPMSLESALFFLQLPASVKVNEDVQSLVVSAKEFLAAIHSDFHKSWEKMMDLPLCGIEVVLGSKGLRVESEDFVLTFVLSWVCKHYPKIKERREILASLMTMCVCFACLSSSKLKQVFDSRSFGDDPIIQKLVTDALFLKTDSSSSADIKCNTLERMYKLRPVKVVQLDMLPLLRGKT